ncbi:ABC-2 family transporter protein [Streptomyces sp. NPDC051172]|uniref:ABC transporter permease n=1 Tax=Streptomyces sp. NPDC051172 TaxID=3155796 RepID=UPI00341F6E61
MHNTTGAVTRKIPSWRTYLLLAGAAFRAQFQYRANFLLLVTGGVAYQCAGLALVWVVVEQFGHFAGWTLADIAFLYGLRLTAHALSTIPFSQLQRLDDVVRNGEFDRYLIRPAGLLTQVLTRQVNLQVVGDLAGGLGVLVSAVVAGNVAWTAAKVLYLTAALASGALIEASLQLAASALCFHFVYTQSFRLLIDSIFNTFGGYPMIIFPIVARFSLTFILPLAFVAYLPATVILGLPAGLPAGTWLAYATPLLGPVLFTVAYRFWHSRARHYSSTGQ